MYIQCEFCLFVHDVNSSCCAIVLCFKSAKDVQLVEALCYRVSSKSSKTQDVMSCACSKKDHCNFATLLKRNYPFFFSCAFFIQVNKILKKFSSRVQNS